MVWAGEAPIIDGVAFVFILWHLSWVSELYVPGEV
jgi:hypothetical protein